MEKLSSLDKFIKVLDVLSREPYELKIGELSQRVGINRTSVHRILSELLKIGYVIRDEATKNYKIGPTLYQIGNVYLNNYNYENKLLEILDQISKEIKESVGYAVREGDRVISLYEIEVHQPLKLNYHPGVFYPMNRGCYGKCLMAYYDQKRVRELLYSQKFEKLFPNTLTDPEEILDEYKKIREQGFVISDEETLTSFVVGVGVPVFNSSGEVKACIASAFIKEAEYKEKIEFHKKVFFEYAKEMTKYIT